VRAEKALEDKRRDPASPWISHFDEGSLASEATRCMRRLGDLDEARRQAERIIMLRPSSRTRSRAFGQLALAGVLAEQGMPDEACGIAQEVLAATQSLGSYLVISQLLSLRHTLQRHAGRTVVTSFLHCMDDAVRERLLVYRQLTRAGQEPCQEEGS
jgi:tetratricopeptide (TPR) repeat protein